MVDSTTNVTREVGVWAIFEILSKRGTITQAVENLHDKGASLKKALKILGQASLPGLLNKQKKIITITDRENGNQKTEVYIGNLWLAEIPCAGQRPEKCWQSECPITAGC